MNPSSHDLRTEMVSAITAAERQANRAPAINHTRPDTVVGVSVLPYETKPENIFHQRDDVAADQRQT